MAFPGIYKISKTEKDNKICIERKPNEKTFNKLIIYTTIGLAVFFSIFIVLPDVISGDVPVIFFFLGLVLILLGGITGGLIAKFLIPLTITSVVLDKTNKKLTTSNNSISIDFSEIKEVTITEKTMLGGMTNYVTLKLADGEKTLPMAFSSYNEAQDLSNQIKELIK